MSHSSSPSSSARRGRVSRVSRFVTFVLFMLLGAVAPAVAPAVGAERPNVLWITAEDMSPTLGCYGDSYANTPHLDRFATASVRYTHAFATAPVCSPSRSCLITGCYAPTLGTHNMRSAFPLPDSIRGFPALLREAGYYTTNNVKTDYNTAAEARLKAESWDECSPRAHWRGRAAGQPFFSVFNLMTSHQSRSMAWPRGQFEVEVQSRLERSQVHDPATAPVPPYYPDTPIIRRTIARYYDCVTAMDREVGDILAQLAADGLADDTIVFFYSDHGSGMPRHKRALLDTGMRVPLLIRFPARFASWAPAEAGDAADRLVSFVDFPPTVLQLAGVTVPEYCQGRSFLGPHAGPPREFVYGHRDRIDEALDTARSVRDGRFLYIRNFMPHLGYNQPSAWPDQGEIKGEFRRLADRRVMTAAQWHYAGPTRPVEELYDCQTDPLNLSNLADSAEHQPVLRRMRDQLRAHWIETCDLGCVPEAELWRQSAGRTPWDAAAAGDIDCGTLWGAAGLVGGEDEAAMRSCLASELAAQRFWGALALAARDGIAPESRQRLKAALEDESDAVRIQAADALARQGDVEPALPVLIACLAQDDLTVVLYAARTIELLGPAAAAAGPAMRRARTRAAAILPPGGTPTNGDQDLAMFIEFATRGAGE